MKIYTGPYLNYWGPYQIAYLLQTVGVSEDRCHAIGRWLGDTRFNDLCEWIHSKRKRTEYIHIDKYDVWSLDSTLSQIIVPTLKLLRDSSHGSALVDDEDVPAHLHCCNSATNESLQYDLFAGEELDNLVWDSYSKKWNWVLDEMIWAFEQNLIDWEQDYWIVKPELDLTEYPEDEHQLASPIRWRVQGKMDWNGRQLHKERMQNGFRLFGKYFNHLWD